MISREGRGAAPIGAGLLVCPRGYCAARETGNAGWVEILYLDVMVSAVVEERGQTGPITRTTQQELELSRRS
jgi:hypothetical protein